MPTELTETLYLRLTVADKAKVDKAAAKRRIAPASYGRMVIVEQAEKELGAK